MKGLKSVLPTASWILLILIPVFLVFKSLFQMGPLAWGDAPHFYFEELTELVAEPSTWVDRGANFGGVNKVLWLSPLMLLYGALGKFAGLGNDLIIRILFYFPSIILAAIGPILLARYLKLSKTVRFFSSLVYLLNTYFILLIDGGQVGVALAYGFFPLALLFLKKLIDKPSFNGFFLAILFSFLLTMADPRIAVIAFLTIFVWGLMEKSKGLKHLAFPAIALAGLSAYWLVPIFKFGQSSLGADISELQLVSLLNPLLLFSPHWPLNQFGKVFPPPFYFVGLPLLIFGSLLFRPKRRVLNFAFLFLFFAFLVKGNTPPVGEWYNWLINKIPFGSAFRDSSKFFVPLILFAGILIGKTVEAFSEKLKEKKLPCYLLLAAGYAYLLFLVSPGLAGKLNFVLSDREHSEDYELIKENLEDSELSFFRTAWFPERHPLTYELQEKPALDAKGLVNERPFADMNVGTYDRFNFMHNERFLDWFELLGIKYLIYSGDTRVVKLDEERQENWDDLKQRTAIASGLKKVNWKTEIPVYEVPETRPRMFVVDQLYAVVGPDPDVDYQLPATVFFEDGKLDPRDLEGIASRSATLVFNNKEKTDLTMSFLQDYFVGPQEAEISDWASFSSSDYLKWKYQLLIRGIETKEFDYGKGVAFSTETGEELKFDFKLDQAGEYILAMRSMTEDKGQPLRVDFGGSREIVYEREDNFEWFAKPFSLKKGKQVLTLKNNEGLHVVNVVALIPQQDFVKAQRLTDTFVEHFGISEVDNIVEESSWYEFGFENDSPVRYKITAPERGNWIVFTDSYHPEWKLKQGDLLHNSLPFYSMVNGFYIKPNWTKTEIVFEGQKQVRWGIYYTAISALVIVIIYLWLYSEKK